MHAQLSEQYAGASSAKSKYTRKESSKSSFWSKVDAAKTNAQRLYCTIVCAVVSILCFFTLSVIVIVANAFLDGSRQLAIDAVLGTVCTHRFNRREL